MDESILKLAKKLKALADRGVGGEKSNAEIMLLKLLEKHNISENELSQNLVSQHYFNVRLDQSFLFHQVAYMVLGHTSYWKTKRKPTRIGLDCTSYQFIEITACFNFYWKEYEKDLKVFRSAFIQKNEILHDAIESANIDELTEEKIDHMLAVRSMMDSIKKRTPSKMLNVGVVYEKK